MRRLTIIMTGSDPERLRDALQVAAAWAALDRPARLFLQGDAVRMVAPPLTAASDERHRSSGQPTLAQLFEEAHALGVDCTACQGSLGLAGTAANALPEGIDVGGLVSLLADAEEDQLLFV